MTTIVIAEDHHAVRHGLRLLLDAQKGLSVVGEASDCDELVSVVQELKPDVLLLDVLLGNENSLFSLSRVLRESARTRVIVLSMYPNEVYVLDALRNGASGYVLKTADSAEVVEAIKTVLVGGRYLSAPLSEQVIDTYLRRSNEEDLDAYELLTPREREILYLIANNFDLDTIVARLGISRRTLETHQRNLMRKLHCMNRGDLVRYALRRGIIVLD